MSEKRKLAFGETRTSSIRKSRIPLGFPTASRSSVSRTSAVRASSATRTTDFPSSSQFGLRRYGSESFLATPLGRSAGALLTPLTRNSVVPDSSRKAKVQNAQRLLETLQKDGEFFTKLGLQNGMKSMTSKQFIGIVDYMFKSFTGKDLQSLAGKDDQFDCIMRILKRLNCPFKINKSMLKTPNTPHTIDQVIELLLWLSDYTSAFHEDEHSAYIAHDDTLPSQPFTAMFSKTVMDGFHLWNKESDEFLKLQDQMVDNYISDTVNNRAETAQQLFTMTDQLRANSADLRALSTTIPDQLYVEELESQFLSYEQQHQDAIVECAAHRKSLKDIHEQFGEAERRFTEKKRDLLVRREHAKQQKYSRDMCNALAKEVELLKTTVDIASIEIKDLKEVESTHAINRARILNQLKIAVPAVAKHLDTVVAFVKASHMNIDANTLNSLTIDVSVSTLKIEHIQKVNCILGKIGVVAQSYLKDITMQKEHISVKANSLRTEQSLLLHQLNELREKHKKLLSDLEVRDGIAKMNKNKLENLETHMKEVETEYSIQCNGKRQAIARSKAKIKNLEAGRKQCMAHGEQIVLARIQQRREQVAQMQALEDEIDAMLKD